MASSSSRCDAGSAITDWNPLEIVESAVIAGQVARSRYGCGLKYAIILLNQAVLNEELFISLWNEASFRMLLDGGGNHWRLLSRKYPDLVQFPHVVCGNFDSIRRETLDFLRLRSSQDDDDIVDIVQFPVSSSDLLEESDFTQAVNLPVLSERLKTLEIPRILAYCETSARFEEIMANVETLYKFGEEKQAQLFMASSSSITFLLRGGRQHRIRCGRRGHPFLKIKKCALLPIGTECIVSTQGLKHDLTKETLAFGKKILTMAEVVGISGKEAADRKQSKGDEDDDSRFVIVLVTNSAPILWDMEFEFDNQLQNIW